MINTIKTFMVKKKIDNFYIQAREVNIIVILLPVSDGKETWHEYLSALRNELDLQTELTLRFALSDVFDKPSHINRAWQQLQYIHTFSARGSNYFTSVEQIKDIHDHSIQLPLNLTMLEVIYSSLSNGDNVTACSILKECFSNNSGKVLSDLKDYEFVAELMHIRLANMIMQLKLENPAVLIDIDVPVYIKGVWQELFEKQYPLCFLEIGSKLRNQSQGNITKFGQRIVDYVNKHLYDHNLYITMVSDHFGISAPTLQKMIKKTLGQTFLVYV
jgi:hypothetical protein